MVTCGLRNVGVPSEGHGQHGDYTFQQRRRRGGRALGRRADRAGPASPRWPRWGTTCEVRRTWRTYAGQGLVQLEDVVTNRGRETEPALQLYHVNLGPPLWSEGAALCVDARETRPRDADAAASPTPGTARRAWCRARASASTSTTSRRARRLVQRDGRRDGAASRSRSAGTPRRCRACGSGCTARPRRARPRAGQLLRPRRRPRPRRGPPARARARRGAPDPARDPRPSGRRTRRLTAPGVTSGAVRRSR